MMKTAGERKSGNVHCGCFILVKDRLFRFLFANDKEALLELYNALNGTAYTDSSKLEIVTIESAVYIVMMVCFTCLYMAKFG